jgi:ankyrin repeat protein
MSMVSLLLDHGEDINGPPGHRSSTALAIAVQESNHELVEYLLDAGANVNDRRGRMNTLETAIN